MDWMKPIDTDNLKARLRGIYRRRESDPRVRGVIDEVKGIIDSLIDVIDNMPTVYPVKHGHWIFLTDRNFNEMYKCSACRDTVSKPSKYCPHCGAFMLKGE